MIGLKSYSKACADAGKDFSILPLKKFVGCRVTFVDFTEMDSKYEGKILLVVNIKHKGTMHKVSCGGQVIVRKLIELSKQMPFEATITKKGRYYDLK